MAAGENSESSSNSLTIVRAFLFVHLRSCLHARLCVLWMQARTRRPNASHVHNILHVPVAHVHLIHAFHGHISRCCHGSRLQP